MPNENIVGGYYGDSSVYYGPSSYRAETTSVDERGVTSVHPLYGPAKLPAIGSLPGPMQFFTSPAGLALLLGFGGYLAWKHVFGE